jgi:DNA repair exonuclease SbcCD ATPase subunit
VATEPDDLLKRLLTEVLEGRRALGDGIEGVGNRLDSFRNETLGNFDGVFGRLEDVESEIQAVSAALARLERAAEEDRPRRESLRLEIEHLKQRLATLESGSLITKMIRPNPIELGPRI